MRFQRPVATTRQPHVHVVIPCYKYGRYLDECVGSVISQVAVTTSVLIIDDASPDDSFSRAEELAASHKNVTARRNPQNLGHIATYNSGLSEADSDYVVLLSADDLLAPRALERACSLMEHNPSVGMTYGRPLNFENAPPAVASRVHSWSVWHGHEWIDAQFRRGLSILYSPEAVVRTSVQHAVGYYDSGLPHTADLDMWLRIATTSDIGRVNGPVQAMRRIHRSSMMSTSFGTLLDDLTERYATFQQFLDEFGDQLSNSRSVESRVRRRLSRELLAWVAENDHAEPSELDRALELARTINPDCARLPVWQEARVALRAGPAGARARIFARLSRAHRAVDDRLRWQRWAQLGV